MVGSMRNGAAARPLRSSFRAGGKFQPTNARSAACQGRLAGTHPNWRPSHPTA